jgi:hypothetical protein
VKTKKELEIECNLRVTTKKIEDKWTFEVFENEKSRITTPEYFNTDKEAEDAGVEAANLYFKI